MTAQYMPLSVAHWKVVTQQELKSRKPGTNCKVQTMADKETHKPVGIHLTWQILINTDRGTYVDCETSQGIICEDINTATVDDIKELIQFSQKNVKVILIEKGKEEGCKLLSMKLSMINETAQLKQIVSMIQRSA